MTEEILIGITSVSFVLYGMQCLISKRFAQEFIRFGLNDTQRKITGILQLSGALGLGFGYFYSKELLFISGVGLCALMFLGCIVRWRIKDSLIQTSPALLYFLMTLYIVVSVGL